MISCGARSGRWRGNELNPGSDRARCVPLEQGCARRRLWIRRLSDRWAVGRTAFDSYGDRRFDHQPGNDAALAVGAGIREAVFFRGCILGAAFAGM